ncbi:MAG: T9SS type A sorting domain-containing protein [Flavipsychrobacter sp.]
MKQLRHFRLGSNSFITKAALTIALGLSSLSSFGQATVINNYTTGENLKNYAVEEVPGSNGNAMIMAGTIFGTGTIASPRTKQGESIHFMYTTGAGDLQWGGTYSVGVRYDLTPEYEDVRCVDIVPYTSTEALIVVEARALNHPRHNTRDLILVLRINIADGRLLNTYEIASPLPQSGDYANIYATHAIYHEEYNGGTPSGNSYLYICGYDGLETDLGGPGRLFGDGTPNFIPQWGPSCQDKRILLIKFDIDNNINPTPQVVGAKTYDKPWVQCSVDQVYPELYDFDMAMRIVPMNDGTGDLYITGSTNSDYIYDNSKYSSTPAMWLSYGSATLSLRVDEAGTGGGAFNTVALRPFIENKVLPFGGETPSNLRMFEHGYGAFEDNLNTGLYVFSNAFLPDNSTMGTPSSPGTGFKTYAEMIRMTYIDKATLNFTPYTQNHRIAFSAIDYNWGTQVLPSPNGTDKLYLAGLQSGWDQGNCGNPTNGNNPPTLSNNINPFMAEIEPTWSGTNIGINNINFWKTYFTQNNTGYFDDLGGGLSNITWATEFVANNPNLNARISFMAPKWDPNSNVLGVKYYRTDGNGDLSTATTLCNNSYQHCTPVYSDIDIADGWWNYDQIEDPNISLITTDGSVPFKLLIPAPAKCKDFWFYKPSGVANANTKGLDNAQFEVYPNPANTYVSVKVKGEVEDDAPVSIALYNVMGQHVASLYDGTALKLKSDYRMELPSSLATGVYILKVTSKGSELHTQSVSIQ